MVLPYIAAILGIFVVLPYTAHYILQKIDQTNWEKQFINNHRDIIQKLQPHYTLLDEHDTTRIPLMSQQEQSQSNSPKTDYIPLEFDAVTTTNMLKLCMDTEYYQKFSVIHSVRRDTETYVQKVDIQYLGFRRVKSPPQPLRIQLIRCTEKYAIIGDENCRIGYLLVKGNANENNGGEIFYIYSKFVDPQPFPKETNAEHSGTESSKSESPVDGRSSTDSQTVHEKYQLPEETPQEKTVAKSSHINDQSSGSEENHSRNDELVHGNS